MNKYSVSQWIYGDESLEKSLARLQRLGYHGIELKGEGETVDVGKVKQALARYDLEVSTICGSYGAQQDLAADSASTRGQALDYLKANIDYAAEVGSDKLIVVPSAVGKLSPDSSYAQSWEQALTSVRLATEYAQKSQVTLVLEAVNRYETFLVPNLATAHYFAELIDMPALSLMADVYHMSLEERDSLASLALIKERLVHVHLADSTREGLGYGQLDFSRILKQLQLLDYTGYLTMEFLVRDTTLIQPGSQPPAVTLADEFTERSLSYLRALTKEIAEGKTD